MTLELYKYFVNLIQIIIKIEYIYYTSPTL